MRFQYYIYQLLDPETNEIRYVGYTWHHKNRYRAYVTKASFNGVRPIDKWCKCLHEKGLAPIMEIVATISGDNHSVRKIALDAEQSLIRRMSRRCNLLNVIHNQPSRKNGTSTKDKIRLGRDTLGLTQQDFADSIGVTLIAVSKWERGETKPSTKNLPKLATAFNTTVDALLSE